MRVFADDDGAKWTAATVFGSYGEARLIFSRQEGDELRTLALAAENLREAERNLSALDEKELRTYLKEAEPYDHT
jgi:hypothetical protein